MKDRVLGLLPLDNRPCTSRFPRRIAEMGGFSLEIPPLDFLGDLHRPASVEGISNWLKENASRFEALILSIDTLGFGGLIPSRRSNDSIETVLERLALLKDLKDLHPDLKIYAFGIAMRLSRHAAIEEEKSYWADYGEKISRYSYHLDRFAQRRQPEDQEAFLAFKKEIPPEILRDYQETRRRNFQVLAEMIRWAKAGLFEALHIGQDDGEEYGLNVAEKRRLVFLAGKDERILVYPGADEVAATLLAKFLNREGKPSFFPVFSHPGGEKVRGMYEDCSIEESVRRHVLSASALLAASEEEADFILFLNVPSTRQGDLCLELLEGVDSPPRELEPFFSHLRKTEKPALLVDAAYANGADPELMSRLCRADLERLETFSAWNTTGNSLGTAIAAASAIHFDRLPEKHRKAKKKFLLERVAEDYVFQTLLRSPLRRSGDLASGKLNEALNTCWLELFGRENERFRASYPWGRFFEADIELEEQ